MIVSASRRTDIPAFHTEWFLNRLREGYCIVTHHTASGIYHRVPLTADVVDCIVFRSKNPAPMLRRLDDMRVYNYLFNITMNPYGREMESHVPRLEERIETCAEATDLEEFGIGHGACVERRQIEEIVGNRFGKVKESYLRPHCNCMESVDIGHYSTCNNGCLYCYATPEQPNMRTDPASPSLDPLFDSRKIAQEQIIDLKAESHRATQMTLF